MGVYRFLSSLPAVFGIAGFFAYLWAGQSRVGGDILKKIVNRLREKPNLEIEKYGTLTPAKLRDLVGSDERVRQAVNDGDRDLLKILIILQYMLTSLVLLVCAALIGVTVWLYMRPEPLSVTQTGPKAVISAAEGHLVDLDPIIVDWTAAGAEETMSIFLENVDSGRRTEKKTVTSSVRSVQFEPIDLSEVATNRGFHAKNRIRSVIEWKGGISASEPNDLFVGIEVDLQLYGRLVSPEGTDRTIHTLFATIDRNTARLPSDYFFKGDFVATTTDGPLVVPLSSRNNDGEVIIPELDRVDWGRPVGFVYGGPDDPWLVRALVSGKNASGVTTRTIRR